MQNYQDQSTGDIETVVKSTNGNPHSYEQGIFAGERNRDSATTSYQVTRHEANATIIDVQTAVIIGAGAANDTHLMAIHIHTALAGTCVIAGFLGSDGVTPVSYTLPIGAVGTYNFQGLRNAAGALTITASTVGDSGKILVAWRPI